MTIVGFSNNLILLIAFGSYLIILFSVGFLGAKYFSKNLQDFFLGGRRMKDFVVALSAVVSGRSGWLILGFSGMAYIMGVSAVWALVGYIIVELFLFLFLGKRLRRYTQQKDIITIPEYLEVRFESKDNILRIISVIIIIIFLITYISGQLLTGGKTFHAYFPNQISQNLGIIITAGIILIYTIMGGFAAVSFMDVFHACLMIMGLVILPFIAIIKFGGITKLINTLASQDPNLINPWALGIGGLISFIGIGLGSPGNPHILVRYMSVEKPELLRKSALIGTIWNVLMGWGALFIGLIGRALYPTLDKLPAHDKENVFTKLAMDHLHPVLVGFIIATIFAAILSTVDSQLLVASSSITRDIYEKVIKKGKKLSDKFMVTFGRITILLLLIIAVFLTLAGWKSIFWLVLLAWSGLGASFGPIIILSLFWARTTKWGALAGLLTGTVVTIIWKLISQNYPNIIKNYLFIKYELIPAFILSLLAVIIVSLITSPPKNAEEDLKKLKPVYKFQESKNNK